MFRVVNTTARYSMGDGTMIVSDVNQNNEISHGILGIHLTMFRQALSKLYPKVMLQYKAIFIILLLNM